MAAITSLTEDMIARLAEGIERDALIPELARRISLVEGVRAEVLRLDREAHLENVRHADAVARVKAERAEWQGQCPHPAPGRARCPVCGKEQRGGID